MSVHWCANYVKYGNPEMEKNSLTFYCKLSSLPDRNDGPVCMKFCKVSYSMFHGKALRFMAGVKSTGQFNLKSISKTWYLYFFFSVSYFHFHVH